MKVFGCLGYAKRQCVKKDKFEERAEKCIFIGYPYAKKGWKMYSLDKHDIFVSHDVVFYEDNFPFLHSQPEIVDSPGKEENEIITKQILLGDNGNT